MTMEQNEFGLNKKMRVRLSPKEWKLLTEETFIEDELIDSVETDGNKICICWSSDELECVIGYLAEAANHVEEQSIVKQLDKLLDKLDKIEYNQSRKFIPTLKVESGEDVPEWAKADAKPRTTAYSEAELDALTKGTIGSIDDLEVWKSLVERVGLEEATETIRRALRNQQILSKKPGH